MRYVTLLVLFFHEIFPFVSINERENGGCFTWRCAGFVAETTARRLDEDATETFVPRVSSCFVVHALCVFPSIFHAKTRPVIYRFLSVPILGAVFKPAVFAYAIRSRIIVGRLT